MKKQLLLLFVLSCFLFSCNKKERFIENDDSLSDSLAYYIKQSTNTKLSNSIRLVNNQRALNLLKESANTPTTRIYILKVANSFKSLNEYNDFGNALDLILEKSTQAKDSTLLGKTLNTKANYYIDTGSLDSAFTYFTRAEKIFKFLKDSLNLGNNYLDKAFIQVNIGDYFGGEQSSSLSLSYLKNRGLHDKEYFAYNYIGICSNELGKYENAIVYHKRALETAKKNNLPEKPFSYQATSLNNIGVVYQQLDNYQESINNFNLALQNKNLLKENPYFYTQILTNLAYSKFKLKDYSELPQLFYEPIKIAEDLELQSVPIRKVYLSEYFLSIKDTSKAILYARQALKESKSLNSKGDLLASLKQLSLLDKVKSAEYSKEYIRLTDSIQTAERKSADKFARISFETDQIIQEKDLLEDKNRIFLYTFIGVVFLLSILFMVRAQRARTRELMLKQAQQRANEEIYNLLMTQQDTIDQTREAEKKKISRDLHDGILGRMFGVRINLDSINHKEDEESIKKRAGYLNELKEIEQDIREISHDLNREKQHLVNNFVSIVTNLFDEQSNTHSATLTYFMDSRIKWDLIKNNVKINIFRILQESLQNINKYAKANNVHVEFKIDEENQLKMIILDDGIGFDVTRKSKGIGMQNMISRAIDCNGKLEITSNKENGTKVILIIFLE